MEGIIMAKKLGKLFTLAVTAGTAAAAAYYYLQNKKAAVQEAPEEEDDFEKDPEDDFDDTDFTDDDFVDERSKRRHSRLFFRNERGRAYLCDPGLKGCSG